MKQDLPGRLREFPGLYSCIPKSAVIAAAAANLILRFTIFPDGFTFAAATDLHFGPSVLSLTLARK